MCGREQRASGSDEWVLDTAELRAFIAYVQETIARAPSPEQACERLRPRFAELLADHLVTRWARLEFLQA